MKIKFRDNDCTECWDGVFYKKLSKFPNITDWELQTISDFISYEKKYGRDCEIEGEANMLSAINDFLNNRDKSKRVKIPRKIKECTACPKYKGCVTDLVCHTTSIENAIKIFECGSLLSPVKARKMSADELMKEHRNAANDPADYFEYIMFAWGNCQAGDRLVMERKMKRFPNEKDLSIDFTPGVRFFFKYENLIKHPNAIFDGVLPLKIKDEVILADWVSCIIIPECERETFKNKIKEELIEKVYYVENNCKDIWKWSEKVYEIARKL